MRERHHTAALLGLVIVLIAVVLSPARLTGQIQCLLCHEAVRNHEQDPRKEPVWVWEHFFDPDSGDDCAADPAEMCRPCGGTSGCHPPTDPDVGRCHDNECPPASLASLLEIGATVSKLALRLDDRTGPVLAQIVALEPRLVYDKKLHAVKLTQCDGTVAASWLLGGRVGRYFSGAA